MRCIIAGSRNIIDYEVLLYHIKCCRFSKKITTVVSGTAPGVDTLGERWAKENNIPIDRYPANWKVYKKAAGVIRNSEMSDNADSEILIWDGKSPGTKNMLSLVKKKGLIYYLGSIA